MFRGDEGKGVAAPGAVSRFLWAPNWTSQVVLQTQKLKHKAVCGHNLSQDQMQK